MKEQFSFEFDWLPQDHGSEVERCTAADVAVQADGIYFTELEDLRARTVRQRMRVSANTLALWLAENWWRLRWEAEPRNPVLDWRMSHCLAAAGGGHVWPSLFFCSDGETVRLDSKVSARCNFPVHYLYHVSKTIAVRDFESGVDNFIESVIARLIENNLHDTELVSLWREVQQERHDPVLASYRKMEALLGFDADECPDSLMEELGILSGKYGRGAIEEMASACGSDVVSTINTLVSDGKAIAQSITIPSCTDICVQLQQQVPENQATSPWKRAEQAAKIVRNAWGLDLEKPVETQRFSEIVSLDSMFLTSSARSGVLPMSVGFRSDTRQDLLSVVLDKRPLTSRRFALARIIGDNFLSKPDDHFLPATQASTVRQKFQRAFAQELLCPFEGLISIVGEHASDDDAIEDAACVFEVSPLLVKTTLVNKGLLDRECLL